MSTLLLRWRFFWSRRSRSRIALAVALVIVMLLAITYLALPASAQTTVRDTVATAAHGIRALGLHTLLVIGIAACALVTLLLILLPSYRHPTYLATAPSLIPPVSVYVDAENQPPAAAIRPFVTYLITQLRGRRADLLYFLNSRKSTNGPVSKELYQYGFRLVDVPHNPLGGAHIVEAVDKELALHAYERAILGPAQQEFIIVTGDAGYASLIYRLVALGHRVQLWSTKVPQDYHLLKNYLSAVKVVDLTREIPDLHPASPKPSAQATTPTLGPDSKPKHAQKHKQAEKQQTVSLPVRPPVPASLFRPAEAQLYYAITDTITARNDALHGETSQKKRGMLNSLLNATYRASLVSVGYGNGKWIECWLEHLTALGVLEWVQGDPFPNVGSASAEDAARSLYAIAEAAARAAAQAALTRPDGIVSMNGVATALAADDFPSDAAAAPLLKLLAPGNDKREPHARYFVRSARALGLLAFGDVPGSLDQIAYPHLSATEPASDTDATMQDEASPTLPPSADPPDTGSAIQPDNSAPPTQQPTDA